MENGSRTSGTASTWARLVLPSIADVIFLALLCTLVFSSLSVRLLGDAGIGWHIRTGQIILGTHQIPRTDPFSSTMVGKPWFAWEWLYDLVVGGCESTTGLNGVVWFNAVLIATVFACAFQWLMRRGVNVLVALGLVLLAISASMIHFLARPHIVTWLFTLAWFAILDTSEREALTGRLGRSSWLWSLPLLMLVWVNLHGGFVLGFVLLGIYWLAAFWTWWQTEAGRLEDALVRIAAVRRAWELVWVGIICGAVSLINPYGWNLHQHVFAYLSDRFLMNHIQEFQSPDFHGWAQRCFLVLLLITTAAVGVRRRRLRPSELLVILFSIYSGLYAARNIPVSSLLLVAIIGPVLCTQPLPGPFGRMSFLQSSLRGHGWPIIAVVFGLIVAANGGGVGSTRLMDSHFDSKRMPVAAVDYLQQHELRGPILSTDFWGGYLIYRLYPRKQIVVDDRHDLYGEAFFKSYLNMYRDGPAWREFLEKHPAGCLLLPRDAAITTLLLENRGWKSVYRDDVAVIFVPVLQE